MRDLGIYPPLKAGEGAEAIVVNRFHSFPEGNHKPAVECYTRRLFGDEFYLLATGVTNKTLSLHSKLPR